MEKRLIVTGDPTSLKMPPGLRRSLANARQLHEHKGPYYERWQAACKSFADRYLLGVFAPPARAAKRGAKGVRKHG